MSTNDHVDSNNANPNGEVVTFCPNEAEGDSHIANVPSTVPTKRGRGRPKGSKNKNNLLAEVTETESNSGGPSTGPETKKPKVEHPNRKLVKSCPGFDPKITEAERETGNEEITESVLMRFDAVRRRLCQLERVKLPLGLLEVAKHNCNSLGVRTNEKRRIGPVPGVHVGDIFYYYAEMNLVGLHLNNFGGIDYLKSEFGGLAVSVVTSGRYNDEREDLETLVYTGQGQACFHQKLEKGNSALVESFENENEVRVIRGEKDPKDENKKIYIYDGVYTVTAYSKPLGESGFGQFKFTMVRKPGQPSGYGLWKAAANRKTYDFILPDISFGTEDLPIGVVNEVDKDDKNVPEEFVYIASLECSNNIFDLNRELFSCVCEEEVLCSAGNPKCICIQRNDGELPYHDRILVSRRPMVYECGQYCHCPPWCKNRLVQSGLTIRLEVFKTRNCGWGLRSWEPIRAGTFICEFAGVIKTREEVDEGNDEYVFDSSRVFNRFKWNYEPELVGEDHVGEEQQVSEVFNLPTEILISAKEKGNIARFINHGCNPNVLWQPIEIEENDATQVRIGLFAKKHIPPLRELRFDYGMSAVADEVGEDGTKGKKICLCGSDNCRGSFG